MGHKSNTLGVGKEQAAWSKSLLETKSPAKFLRHWVNVSGEEDSPPHPAAGLSPRINLNLPSGIFVAQQSRERPVSRAKARGLG